MPASVRAPDLVKKALVAEVLAEKCYWQMPFDRARKVHDGLPYAKWANARTSRGLALQ